MSVLNAWNLVWGSEECNYTGAQGDTITKYSDPDELLHRHK